MGDQLPCLGLPKTFFDFRDETQPFDGILKRLHAPVRQQSARDDCHSPAQVRSNQ